MVTKILRGKNQNLRHKNQDQTSYSMNESISTNLSRDDCDPGQIIAVRLRV